MPQTQVGRQQNKTVVRQYINRRAEGKQENLKEKKKKNKAERTDTVRHG